MCVYICALHTSGMHTYTWACLEVQLSPSKLKSWRPCLALDKIRLMPVELISFLACIDLSNLFLYFHSGSAGNCVLKGAFLHFTVLIKCAGWELAVGHWSWFYFRGDKAVVQAGLAQCGVAFVFFKNKQTKEKPWEAARLILSLRISHNAFYDKPLFIHM